MRLESDRDAVAVYPPIYSLEEVEIRAKESAFALSSTEVPDPVDYRGALAQFETVNAGLLSDRAARREQEKARFRADAPDFSTVMALRPDTSIAGKDTTASGDLKTAWREFASAIADLPPDKIRHALSVHEEEIDFTIGFSAARWNSTLALPRIENLQAELADMRAERAADALARQSRASSETLLSQSPEPAIESDVRLDLQEARLEAAIQANSGAFRYKLSELETQIIDQPPPAQPDDVESPQG